FFPTPPGPPNESLTVTTPEPYIRDSAIYTIPVDIIRIMNLSATGITLNNQESTISYFLTGDALVRVVIARPGSGFIVDSNGDIQAADPITGIQDDSLLVSTFSYQRKAGANT